MCVRDKPLAGQKQNDIILMFFPQTEREEQLVILARWLKSLTVSSSTIPAGVFAECWAATFLFTCVWLLSLVVTIKLRNDISVQFTLHMTRHIFGPMVVVFVVIIFSSSLIFISWLTVSLLRAVTIRFQVAGYRL